MLPARCAAIRFRKGRAGSGRTAVVALVFGALVGCTAPPTTPSTPGDRASPSISATQQAESSTPTASQSASAASERPKTPARKPSVLDRPLPLKGRAGEPEVVATSDGTACRTSDSATLYGGYPAASCKLWQPANGLRTGKQAKKGSKRIACQRNLGRPNPVFTEGQSNTWWVWTTSNSGTWDWFPETALAEGASDQPINGIALCQPLGRAQQPRTERPEPSKQPDQPREAQPEPEKPQKPQKPQKRYRNCDELNAEYPNGVGLPEATDNPVKGAEPVTNFTKDAALYRAQSGNLDRDKDKIACEQQ